MHYRFMWWVSLGTGLALLGLVAGTLLAFIFRGWC